MVNKNSPWYMEDKDVPVVETVEPISESYTFKFNNLDDKLSFLERYDFYKTKLSSFDGLEYLKKHKTFELIYISTYKPEIDKLEIDEDVPIGYFRMFDKFPGFNEVEIK